MQSSNVKNSLFGLLVVASAASAACEGDDTRDGVSNDETAGQAGSTVAGRGGAAGQSHGNSGAGQSSGGGTRPGTGGVGGKGAGTGGTRPGAGAGGIVATGGSAGAGSGRGGTPAQGGEAGEGGGGDGGDGAAGEGGSPGPGEGREFVYVSRLVGGIVSLAPDETSGVPRELESSPSRPGRLLYAIAVSNAHRFLYTVEPDPGHLDAFRIAADGTLPEDPSSSIPLDVQPITLAVDPTGALLYVGTLEDQSIRAFAIDAETGALSPAREPLVLDSPPAYVAADPAGRFLYVSQSFEPGIRGYRVGPALGALEELEGSPFGETLVRAGAMVFEPDGRFLFSAGQGLNAFGIDETSGELTPVEGSPFSVDIGSDFFASNIAMDPRGEFLYTTSFLTTRHVAGFSIDPVSGALEEVPSSPLTTSSPYSVAVEPAGRFVYVGNDDGGVSVFSIDRGSGSLDELDDSPFPFGGLQPEFAFLTVP